MPQPHWRLILNGNAAGDDDLREAVSRIRTQGITLEVRVTWEAGDGARFVDEAIVDGVHTIIAAGGDGTLGEVAAGMARHGEATVALPTLGMVPLGTANDFASAAGLPTEPLAALELLSTSDAVPIDLLKIEGDDGEHWCVNVASGGFGTQVTVEAHDGLKKVLGGVAYLITGMFKLGKIEPIQIRLEGPDFAWEGAMIALGIGNGRQAGGGHALCPDALLDDGQLDLTIVPELSGEVAAVFGTWLADGKGAALEQVAVRSRMSWLRIEAPEPLTLNLDGEPVTSRRFHVTCVPRRIRAHLPQACPLLSE
ncbi:lipid kinase YegS [Noviluteimonas gilva]|uniref:Probable lipid kinase YegS-like n=1 Tax=Noviluteimonas gilva TaxID=2682097 RepID=A0A7C9I6S2_9GAMM|nr:lipid kinase YegS [Lysobacter gilvus]MUV15189.1 lipid kinase YegS [Lysobacter gilvus]